MKRFLILILSILSLLCITFAVGCVPADGGNTGGNTNDEFAIANISNVGRGDTVDIVFTDESESEVVYRYDNEYFEIEGNTLTICLETPNGTYKIKARNDFMEIEFTVTVFGGDNLILTLSNDQTTTPFNLGSTVAKGTAIKLLKGTTVVETSTVGAGGIVSFEAQNGTYTVEVDGYVPFNVTLNGHLDSSYSCKYALFSDKTTSESYANNGYVNLSSSLDFATSGIVYAEMTIYAPTDVATAQNGKDIGGTAFRLDTENYAVGSTTKNDITFGGHWDKTYYHLRWGNERWDDVKKLDATMLAKLTNQSTGLKIAIAVQDGLAYAFAENDNGFLEFVGMTGGQIYVNDIAGIITNLPAKVSNVRYSTNLTSVKLGTSTVSSILQNRTSYVLDTSSLDVTGSQANGYAVTGTTSGAVALTKALQKGYYSISNNGVISFDFNYTVTSSSRYYPSIIFNDSAVLQLCVWDGKLTLKYNDATIAQNSNFNNGNTSGSFKTTIAMHADANGNLAFYVIKNNSETLLYSTDSHERPFKFSMIRKIDVAYQSDSANQWSITNLFVNKSTPQGTIIYENNPYVTYTQKPTAIGYLKSGTIKFSTIDGYQVDDVLIDGASVPFTTSNGVTMVNYQSVNASPVHTIEVTGKKVLVNYQFKTSELSKYKIIYPTENSDYLSNANTLKNAISSKYGVNLTVSSDTSTAVTDYEILLGNTNRFADKTGKLMQYSVTVGNGKFRINVGGVFSADQAITYLVNNVFNGTARTLTPNTYYSTNLITTKQAITSGANLRMMTTNILADEFNTDANYKNAAYRAEIYAGILIAYTPDVVGVQESDASWSPLLDKYIAQINEEYGYNYARLYSTYENMVNFTSLIYRADKLSVGTSGVQVFSWWYSHSTPTYHMRNITWAQFTLKSNTSKKFIFANTHWSYRTEHQDKYGTDTLRTQNKNETESFLSTMKSKYSTMPIFLVGDFNTSAGYFTTNGYYKWLVSKCNLISTQASSNGTLITAIPTSGYFDHIFGTGTYTVKRYDHFTTPNYKNKLSDHPFAYTDLAI